MRPRIINLVRGFLLSKNGGYMRYFPLTKNNDFNRAYRKGKNYVHPHIVVYIFKNRLKKTRVGITTSKKIGNAVTRNRARRVIRHALYDVLPKDAGSYDIVLVARGQTPRLKSWQLKKTLKEIFNKSGLININKDNI